MIDLKSKVRTNRAIVTIGTPLQLINAVEYLKSALDESWEVDLVDVSVSNEHRPVIDKTLEFLECRIRNHYRLPFTRQKSTVGSAFSSVLNRFAFAFSGIRHPTKYDLAVVGHFSLPVYKYFLRKSTASVVVDDGLFVLSCPERRKREIDSGKPDVITGSVLHRLNRLLWHNSETTDSVTWFSRYDISVPEPDTFAKNTLANLRSTTKAKRQSQEILFIGMNVVECGILNLQDYLSIISALADHFQPYRFTYVAKYSETAEVVDRVTETLRTHGGQVIRPNVNFEVYLANLDYNPRFIMSLYTSALINAMDILGAGSNYVSIDISHQHSNPRLNESIFQCYQTIAQHEFFRTNGTKISFSDLPSLPRLLRLG